MSDEKPCAIRCEGLVKIYRSGENEVFALQGLDLEVAPGEMLAIVGTSGSGKSSLLNILGGLDAPTAGAVEVLGWDLLRLKPSRRDAYRRSVTGFVWQSSGLNLLPYVSAVENVLLAMSLTKRPDRIEALHLLDLVGLAAHADRLPTELSGGEQQRVAVAVGLANRPALLLADEPTGSLDVGAGHSVLEALRHVNRALGATVIMVTHDPEVAKQANRTVRIRDGKVTSETAGGESETSVIDRVGRVQVPQYLLDEAGIGRKVELVRRDREIVLRAPNSD